MLSAPFAAKIFCSGWPVVPAKRQFGPGAVITYDPVGSTETVRPLAPVMVAAGSADIENSDARDSHKTVVARSTRVTPVNKCWVTYRLAPTVNAEQSPNSRVTE